MIPFTPNAGLMTPRKGFTPVPVKEKMGEGRFSGLIDALDSVV